MTKQQKAMLIHAMVMDSSDYTIKDYMDVVNGVKTFATQEKTPLVLPSFVIEKDIFEKKVACTASKIVIEDTRDKISTIAMAKKIGFAAGLRPGSIYGIEKAKWTFEIGDKHWALQHAFRESYKEGKQYFTDTLNGTNG